MFNNGIGPLRAIVLTGYARAFAVVEEVAQQEVVVGVLRPAKIGHQNDGVPLVGFGLERVAEVFSVAGAAVDYHCDRARLVGRIGDVVVHRNWAVAKVPRWGKGEGSSAAVDTAV